MMEDTHSLAIVTTASKGDTPTSVDMGVLNEPGNTTNQNPILPPPPADYSCPACGATFPTQEELNQHLQAAHGALLCPVCGMPFSTLLALNQHMSVAHPPAQTPGIGTSGGTTDTTGDTTGTGTGTSLTDTGSAALTDTGGTTGSGSTGTTGGNAIIDDGTTDTTGSSTGNVTTDTTNSTGTGATTAGGASGGFTPTDAGTTGVVNNPPGTPAVDSGINPTGPTNGEVPPLPPTSPPSFISANKGKLAFAGLGIIAAIIGFFLFMKKKK